MKIVGIAGKAGAGKDTVADFLVAHHGYKKLSMAGPLKAGLAAMGFSEPANREDKERIIPGFDFTWRDAAQKLGTEWGRALDADIWIKIMSRHLRESEDRIVVSDIRFENEAEMIRAAGGKMLILVGRQADLGEASTHTSEAGVMLHPDEDGLIDNSGPLENTQTQVGSYLGLTSAPATPYFPSASMKDLTA